MLWGDRMNKDIFNQARPLKARYVGKPKPWTPMQLIDGYVTFGNVWHVRKKLGRFWLNETRKRND